MKSKRFRREKKFSDDDRTIIRVKVPVDSSLLFFVVASCLLILDSFCQSICRQTNCRCAMSTRNFVQTFDDSLDRAFRGKLTVSSGRFSHHFLLFVTLQVAFHFEFEEIFRFWGFYISFLLVAIEGKFVFVRI